MSDDVLSTSANSVSPSKTWRAVISMMLLVLWVLFMLVVYSFCQLLFSKYINTIYTTFHRGCCWIFSMKCHVEGDISNHQPTLFLSNHISYLDVFVLGSVWPSYFIAKSEVASWPVLGWLAKKQNTLFFERNGQKIRGQLVAMTEHFSQEKSLTLFPEGTSTEGEHVEPFKSSLLQSVENIDTQVLIQPVTVAYTNYQNKPMNRFIRDHYAWYAKMPFGSHFFSALGMGKSDVKIIFHPTVRLDDFESRKECAFHCWQQVSDGLNKSIHPKETL